MWTCERREGSTVSKAALRSKSTEQSPPSAAGHLRLSSVRVSAAASCKTSLRTIQSVLDQKEVNWVEMTFPSASVKSVILRYGLDFVSHGWIIACLKQLWKLPEVGELLVNKRIKWPKSGKTSFTNFAAMMSETQSVIWETSSLHADVLMVGAVRLRKDR